MSPSDANHPAVFVSYKGAKPLYVFFALLAFCLIVYSSVYQFPYTLGDSTFLIRSYRGFSHFDVVQGRPFQWYAIDVTAWLYFKMGMAAFAYARGGMVVGLAVWALLIFLWIDKWESNRLVSALLSALAVTLTAQQVNIGNGFWFIVPLVVATASTHLLWCLPKKRLAQAGKITLAFVLLIFSLAYYQPFILIPIAMLAVPVIYNAESGVFIPRGEGRAIFRVVMGAVVATIFYYVLWKLLFSVAHPSRVSGYQPTQILGAIPANIQIFFKYRLPTATTLWVGNYKGWLGAGALGATFFGALALDIATAVRQGGTAKPITILKSTAPRYLTLLALLIAGDALFFAASAGKLLKYSTASSIQFVILMVHWNFFLSLIRAVSARKPGLSWRRPSIAGLALLVLTAGLLAQHNVLFYLVLNTTLEQRFVTAAIKQHLVTKGPIERIEIHMAPKDHSPFYSGILEFSWRNSDSQDYAYFMTRLALCELGQNDGVPITSFPRPYKTGIEPMNFKVRSYRCGPSERSVAVKRPADEGPHSSVLKIDFSELDNKWSDFSRLSYKIPLIY